MHENTAVAAADSIYRVVHEHDFTIFFSLLFLTCTSKYTITNEQTREKKHLKKYIHNKHTKSNNNNNHYFSCSLSIHKIRCSLLCMSVKTQHTILYRVRATIQKELNIFSTLNFDFLSF